MLVDSHCHLNFPHYADNLDEVITRAEQEGVRYMQTICTRLSEFETIKTIAHTYPQVACSVGVHPNNVDEAPVVTSEELIRLSNDSKVIGLGETGLDYYHEQGDRQKQHQSFIAHMEASQHNGLPVIVHTRDADKDTITLLRQQMQKKSFPGLIHCFSTSKQLALEAIEMGFSISVAGIVTFKNAAALQDIVKVLPLESLLVETDAPFLAPMPFRGKTNEPAYTAHTARFIAQLKDIPYEEVMRVTTDNFFRLFTKAKRPVI